MMVRELRAIFSGMSEHAAAKLACHAGLGLCMALLYYAPQQWPVFSAQPAPTLALDHAVAFQPAWALVYQSVFAVHTLALWLPRRREAVTHYAQSVAIAFACGAAVFWLYPTASPRPEQAGSLLYEWLIASVDGTRNAFPSLHAAMGLLAIATVRRHLQECSASGAWYAALAGWWIALLYSTLATRQHRVLDLAAGLFLGLVAYVFASLIKPNLRRHEAIPVPPRHLAMP